MPHSEEWVTWESGNSRRKADAPLGEWGYPEQSSTRRVGLPESWATRCADAGNNAGMNDQSSPRHALIVGAGLAGSLLACYLAEMGWRVDVFERRSDPRAKGYLGGRSINLALSARGVWGLAGVGLDAHVLERDAIPMRGRMIHPPGGGATVFQPYSQDTNDAINSVSRGGLNLTLLEAAAAMPGVEFHFDQPCVDVDLDACAAMIHQPGGTTTRVQADLVIGADGAFSPVRLRLMKNDRFEYSQSYLEHGYKELMIPAAAELSEGALRGHSARDGFAMEPNALHIWPRGGAMMIALPNRDKSFTCTLFWPLDGEHGLTSLRTEDEVAAFFKQHYPDATPIMPTLVRDFRANPNGSLVTVRCWPWQWGGKTVVIGDAAHAIVPFYGQGMNCAFEDCRVLARCLSEHRDQREALEVFQAERKPNADAIADMALENFTEMRDKVGDARFLYRKRVEQTLHRLHRDRVHPQYNLVSFSTVPYVEARQSGRRLDALLEKLIARLPMGSREELGDVAWEGKVSEIGGELLAKSEAPVGAA